MDWGLLVPEHAQDANLMSNTFETDVLIIGGGPAGSSTALSLLKYSNLKVTIIEQNDLNAIRVGEQVTASLFDLLEYMGIEKEDFDPDSFLPCYGSFAAWGSPNISSRHAVFSTQIDSFQLDREQFDLLLLKKAAERGAIVLPRTKAIEFHQSDEGWVVQFKHEIKGEFTVKAKYLVDASGRQSHVCRKIGAGLTKCDDLVAVGAFLQLRDDKVMEQEILLETVQDGWWYFAALPNQQTVVSLFTDSAIVKEKQLQKVENWIEMLSKTRHIKKKVGHLMMDNKLWVRNAFSHLSDTANQHHFVAVGDAVASFDPISSMGIGFAMSSACHAAKAIMDHQEHRDALLEYQKSISGIFNHYLETKSLYYKKEQRWNDSPFWATRNG